MDAAQAKRLRRLGYKPEVQNGTMVFCKKEDVIGSRFPIKNCAAADSIEESEKLKQENLRVGSEAVSRARAAPVRTDPLTALDPRRGTS